MIPLEDNVSDIIGKAQRGLRISDTELAEKAQMGSQKIRKLREGDFDELALLRVAPALDLAGQALCELAKGEWHPKKIDQREGLTQFNTHYHDMAVNAYLVWDPASRAAVVFDTGADCNEMVRFTTREKLNVQLILLTHAHADHVADLPRLREETGAQVFTSHPVAIVGDSLFAGSMGGGNVSYEDALRNNLEKILTLPNETIICPGHGPMTTVGEEKVHNPFFAEKVE